MVFDRQMPVDGSAAVERRLLGEIARVPSSIASAIPFGRSVRGYREAAPDVDVPAPVCLGEDETTLENTGVEYVSGNTPRAAVKRFSDSGHCPFVEALEPFSRVLSSFVTNRCRS